MHINIWVFAVLHGERFFPPGPFKGWYLATQIVMIEFIQVLTYLLLPLYLFWMATRLSYCPHGCVPLLPRSLTKNSVFVVSTWWIVQMGIMVHTFAITCHLAVTEQLQWQLKINLQKYYCLKKVSCFKTHVHNLYKLCYPAITKYMSSYVQRSIFFAPVIKCVSILDEEPYSSQFFYCVVAIQSFLSK